MAPELLDLNDYDAARSQIHNRVLASISKAFPLRNERFTVILRDPRIDGKRYSLKEQKQAIVENRNLGNRLTGIYEVYDTQTGKRLSRTSRKTVMSVPYLTDRGTFIRNGTEYIVSKQFRLVPTAYTRRSDDGSVETQFNIRPGTGTGFRVFLEPGSGIFFMKHAGRKTPLLPVLQHMGVPEDNIVQAWGKELYSKNLPTQRSPHALNWLKSFDVDKPGKDFSKVPELQMDPDETEVLDKEGAEVPRLEDLKDAPTGVKSILDRERVRNNLLKHFGRMELDPDAASLTLGVPARNVEPGLILNATQKILRVNKGSPEEDDRDSLAFQTIHDAGDFLGDKIQRDQQQILRKMLWKLTNRGGDASFIPTGILDKHVQHLFVNTGLAQAVEEINPHDIYDQNHKVIRLGEGGISSTDAVPKEARNVQSSYLGFVDPIRAPESLNIGIDLRLARGVRKGNDNLLYSRFINAKTGQPEWVSSRKAAGSVIGFTDALNSQDQFVPGMYKSRSLGYLDRNSLDYIVPSGDSMFSVGAHLVPFKSAVKGMRLLMGSKHPTQALPLVSRESPLVRTSDDEFGDVDNRLGPYLGAVRSKTAGVVSAVYPDHIDITDSAGKKQQVQIYNNFPYARKTFIRNTPVVKAGDKITPGSLLATSNFTGPEGDAALGTNLRVVYMNWKDKNYADAVVISESTASKLTSEHMYTPDFDIQKNHSLDKNRYRTLYPTRFKPEQLKTIRDDGTIKPGTVVNYGDPLFLITEDNPPTSKSMGRRLLYDRAVTWEHHFPGVITDVVRGRKGVTAMVRSNVPMQVGDKVAGRYGNKGVVAEIIRDSEMPQDKKGRAYDIIYSPLGIASRTNPAQIAESALGKVASKTGKIYRLPGFLDEDILEFADKELKANRLSDTDDIYDPTTGKTIPKVFNGTSYFYKLQQTAESKGKSRSTAEYTQDDQPAKGGPTGGKHFGGMEQQALLSHGAGPVIKDLKLIKGQRNDDFWRQIRLGQTPAMPKTPLVYEKFKDYIRASGVHLSEGKAGDSIFAMTDSQARDLTGSREIKEPTTYSATTFKPLPGGLFDPHATGSEAEGNRWGFIQLPEPLPNPVMEDSLRSILGMTKKDYEAMLASSGGPEKMRGLLSRIDIKKEMQSTMSQIQDLSGMKRDAAVKRWGYLNGMLKNGVRPEDFMMTRIPVLPPRFRPITIGDTTTVADPNKLYKAMLENIKDYNDAKATGVPDSVMDQLRTNLYQNFKAVIGTADPIQPDLQNQRVEGIMSQLFGKSSPKLGFVQRRVIGTNTDISGLSVVTPNPSLRLNQVGLPEEYAWGLYEPFVIRHMVRSGVPATVAAKAAAEHTPQAYDALKVVIQERPVIINRAPTLHKYSMLAMEPVLTKGRTLQVPPAIIQPLGMDFDGDTASFSVPVSEDAVKAAREKMMPTRNLLDSRGDRPTFTVKEELLHGIYFATRDPDPREKPVVFNSKEEAVQAFRKGEIKMHTPIEIRGEK